MTDMSSAVFGDFSLGQSLADLATTSATPTFNLQFSMLQNQMLDSLSKKIDAYNNDTQVNNVDAFLTLQQNSLNRLLPNITKYQQDVTSEYTAVGGIADDLTTLTSLASGTDSTAFDKLLTQVNSDLQKVKSANGYAVGIVAPDGVSNLQSQGLGLGNFASYTDANSRSAAVTAALTKVQNSLAIVTINSDTASDIKTRTQTKLSAVSAQIQTDQTSSKASQLDDINTLKTNTSNLLSALSVAFQVNSSQAQALNEALFPSGNATQGTAAQILSPGSSAGSVLNLLA